MDRKSWPWKRKSYDKGAAEKAITSLESVGATAPSGAPNKGDQDNYKKPNYVQISVEAYSHLTGLEDQVQNYEDRVKELVDHINELDETLSTAHSEMTTKDNLVKQHAKVAEEAVSGWEKAEAEALSLKNHLDSVTLSKLAAEDRASHLDGALKECMRQIQNLKEEHEQKLHEVVVRKTKQWEKVKLELETNICNVEQELLHCATENAALCRSLQERSNTIINLSEEKSKAKEDIELLKGNIELCEKEINSLKYEHHLISKELEIRNEEKNMSIKSAEVANKEQVEGVKKIAKLEAECQRLRGLVRKKLPGPAALAQMKLEVESLGGDYGETRVKRSPIKSPRIRMSSLDDFSFENVRKYHKENKFLTERLLAMEEETKMLKEALAMCNGELQSSRNICTNTGKSLQSLEVQLQTINEQNSPPICSTHNASNPPSLTSMSEDGNNDEGNCAESCAIVLTSEHSQFKEKNIEKSNKVDNVNHLELMDDFLEMEKLAYSSTDSNAAMTVSDSLNIKRPKVKNHDNAGEIRTGRGPLSEQPHHWGLSKTNPESDTSRQPLERLQERISGIFASKDIDMEKILENIKCIVQDTHDNLPQQSVSCVFKEIYCPGASWDRQLFPEDDESSSEKAISLPQERKQATESLHVMGKELTTAISQIHDFLLFMGKDAMAFQTTSVNGGELNQRIEEFSATTNKVLCSKMSLVNLIHELSHVLAKASEVGWNIVGYMGNEVETNSSDCIDKVVLPEDKVVHDPVGERYFDSCEHSYDSTSYPEVPHVSSLVSGLKSNCTSCKYSIVEFEQIKLEKDNLLVGLTRCTEDLERTKFQLLDKDQLLADVKSQLASAQKTNSLAETQLKCMAESYKSLELHSEELKAEVNLLKVQAENLENELQEEKRIHQDVLVHCQDLREQLERNKSCSEVDIDFKTKQDRELTATMEKLAECQETIFLLGRQLDAIRPQAEALIESPYLNRSDLVESNAEVAPRTSSSDLQDLHRAEMPDFPTSANGHRAGNAPFGPSETGSNLLPRSPITPKQRPIHRPTKSASSSISGLTPEKHARSFSRFFSSKQRSFH